jgi:hypothetical protein
LLAPIDQTRSDGHHFNGDKCAVKLLPQGAWTVLDGIFPAALTLGSILLAVLFRQLGLPASRNAVLVDLGLSVRFLAHLGYIALFIFARAIPKMISPRSSRSAPVFV